MKYCTTTTLVKPTVIICSDGIQHNLVCIFRSYILFSVIFRSSRHFLETLFKSKGKKQIPALGRDYGPRPRGLHGWQPMALASSNVRGGATLRHSPLPEAACWPRRSARGWGVAAMARATRAHQWPMWGKVDGVSMNGVRGMDRARRSVDEAAESGMVGDVLAVGDGS
jgi:hypothetical protein